MACLSSSLLSIANEGLRAKFTGLQTRATNPLYCNSQNLVSSFAGERFVNVRFKQTKPRKTYVVLNAQSEEKVTIDNATVLVVGGGGVGMEVVRKLAKAGSWVTVLQRSDKFRKEIEELGAMLAIGDVLDPPTIEKPFKTSVFDAVVCTVGGGSKNVNVDKDGTINVIKATQKANVKRFIMVSSIGAGDSVKALDPKTLETLGEVLKAKTAAEEVLKSSGLQYTILRPGGLTSDAASGKGVLTENINIVGLISRSDVASLISRILFDERTYSKTLSAIDSERLFPPTNTLDGVELLPLA